MPLPVIEYREGDLFSFVPSQCKPAQVVYLCHCCNDCGAWGAGFVIPLSRSFPLARQEYIQWHRGLLVDNTMPFELGAVQFVHLDSKPKIRICNMIGQHGVGGGRPLRYNALAKCMDHVATVIEACRTQGDHLPVIHAPFFGSDLAGGNWNFIEQLIDDCWLKKNIPVTIHYLPGRIPAGWELPKHDS